MLIPESDRADLCSSSEKANSSTSLGLFSWRFCGTLGLRESMAHIDRGKISVFQPLHRVRLYLTDEGSLSKDGTLIRFSLVGTIVACLQACRLPLRYQPCAAPWHASLVSSLTNGLPCAYSLILSSCHQDIRTSCVVQTTSFSVSLALNDLVYLEPSSQYAFQVALWNVAYRYRAKRLRTLLISLYKSGVI